MNRPLRAPISLGTAFALLAFASASIAQPTFPATNDAMPSDWKGPVFEPSFSFPTSVPANTAHSWATIDFKSAPKQYLDAVLAYVFEGMDKKTWRVQDNPVRKWYHAPWMHPGAGGREFVHGLTRERSSRRGELGSGPDTCRQNWAISFYNPIGAVTLFDVWGDGTAPPNITKALFAPGTVSAKLLFTQADDKEVPLLSGAPTVNANIHSGPNIDPAGCVLDTNPRQVSTLRLLQLDVAVRDARADDTTGWVFGTFVFDGTQPGLDPWAKLVPVGLMWGNDPTLSDADAQSGTRPAESVVLTDVGLGRAFGRSGRMNGPVDNP